MARDQQGRDRGCFQGRRGGRQGQRSGRAQGSPSPRTTIPMAKQQEKIFAPHVQGKPQSATYATVKDAIIQFIQKTYKDGNDVAQSLKDGKEFDLASIEPTRGIAIDTDENVAALQQGGLDTKKSSDIFWIKRIICDKA